MNLTTEKKIALAKGLRSNMKSIQGNADKMYNETVERLGIPEESREELLFFDYIYNDGDFPNIPQLADSEPSREISDREILEQNVLTEIFPHDVALNVTRLEVIDENGRQFVQNSVKSEKVYLSFQDDGKTLKIFI